MCFENFSKVFHPSPVKSLMVKKNYRLRSPPDRHSAFAFCRLYERRQFRTRRRQILVSVDVHAEPAASAQHQTAATFASRTAQQITTSQLAQLLRGHRHNQSTLFPASLSPPIPPPPSRPHRRGISFANVSIGITL